MDFENFGDFIYLILLVVFSIIGAITNSKKKKRQAQGDGESQAPDKNIFETLFGENETEVFPQPAAERNDNFPHSQPLKPDVKSTEPDHNYTFGKDEMVKEKPVTKPKEKSDAIFSKKITGSEISDVIGDDLIKSTEIKSGGTSVILNTDNKEEVKKGIIYSEILKPKYVDW